MDDAAQDDGPQQTTPKGTPIPVPSREQVAEGLRKLAKPIVKPSDDGGSEK
jgi:hypothetical protein